MIGKKDKKILVGVFLGTAAQKMGEKG